MVLPERALHVACPTKSGPRGANTVVEQHLQRWHVLNVHKCVLLGKLKGLQGFSESLQHCIRPQSSVTSLYGRFSALNLPYKEVTEL